MLRRIRYRLRPRPAGSPTPCSLQVPHRVIAFTVPEGDPPPNEGLPPGSFDERLSEDDLSASIEVELGMETPFTVADDEDLFVAVEMAGDDEGVVCIDWCRTVDREIADTRAWWSNSALPTFSWESLQMQEFTRSFETVAVVVPAGE